MKTVRVKKQALVEKIQENLRNHKAAYLEAKQAYIDKVKTFCEERAKEALEDAWDLELWPDSSEFNRPVSYESSYNKALAKLSATLDEEITLDDNEFSNLWMDDWNWKTQFAATYSSLTRKAL